MSKVGIVGLGLIGGSLCKALKQNTDYTIFGTDQVEKIMSAALADGVIDASLCSENLCDCDILLIALYPQDTIDFVKQQVNQIKAGTIIVDMAGVKSNVCNTLSSYCAERGLRFIGGHPMAGIEKSGYVNSFAELFKGASMILCKDEYTDSIALEQTEKLFRLLGFGQVKYSDFNEHDRIIAYTSQLAHVVSNAYIKSPTLKYRNGFSAGSYKDLTRVARLNPDMWAKLFLENRNNLITEIDTFINNLQEYKSAISNEDFDRLYRLLDEGSRLKIQDEEGENIDA